MKDQLATQLKRQRIDKARQNFVTSLIGKDGITLDEEALKAIAAKMQ